MKRLVVLLIAVVALGACSSSSKSSKDKTTAAPSTSTPTTTGAKATDWDPAALAAAKKLADTARAKGIKCDGYTSLAYAPIASDYKKGGLPLPGAMAQCTSAAGENLTFETFGSEFLAYQFMGTKIALVCRTAATQHLAAPQFPYVAGLTWFIEPDNQATSDRLASLLNAKTTPAASRTAHCAKA